MGLRLLKTWTNFLSNVDRALHLWHEQSNSGNDKNQRVLMHVRRSIDNVRFWPLQLRHSYFLWWFYVKISVILSDFCIHGVRKATPVTTKANAFWCNFAGRSTACVFEHCTMGIYVFSCSFRGDLWCIFASFCMILSSRLEAWSRCMNGHRSNSKRVIFITFWSVFLRWKNRITRHVWWISWKINIKLGRKKFIFVQFVFGYSAFYFYFFTRPRKKRDTRYDLGVAVI